MRVVQALYWLKDTLPADKPRLIKRLSKLLADSEQGKAIRQDLLAGFNTLPAWMQAVLRELPSCAVPIIEADRRLPGTDHSSRYRNFCMNLNLNSTIQAAD